MCCRLLPAQKADVVRVVRTETVRVDVDAVFVSCTSLRALPVIKDAEAAIGKPVLASNQVLAWHLMRLAGIADTPHAWGELFGAQLCEAPK